MGETGLENRSGFTPTVGSNPTLSAINFHGLRWSQRNCLRSEEWLNLATLFSCASSLRRFACSLLLRQLNQCRKRLHQIQPSQLTYGAEKASPKQLYMKNTQRAFT